MSKQKLRIHNTDLDNLVSNLRGEVGEIISTWAMLKVVLADANSVRTGNIEDALSNFRLSMLHNLVDKLSDEIVARLSELAEKKIGQLTFYFAQEKLNKFHAEVEEFQRFIKANRFTEKRNNDISHKALPEKWTEYKHVNIPYLSLVKGIVLAIKLMKLIDREVSGPRAKYFWHELRKRRYSPTGPAKIGYLIAPYMQLSVAGRQKIIEEEMREGLEIWKDAIVTVNGVETLVKTYGELGAVLINGHLMIFPDSFVELSDITFTYPQEADNDS